MMLFNADAFKDAMRKDKNIGMSEMFFGGVIMGGSVLAASKAEILPAAMAAKSGFLLGSGIFTHGLTRFTGMNRSGIVNDIRNSVMPPVSALESLRGNY